MSPNSFFILGYDVSHSFLDIFFILKSELLGAVLSGCHTPSQLKALNIGPVVLCVQEALCALVGWLFAHSEAVMCVILGNGDLKTAPQFS